jgi:hypothetical protein
MDKTHELDSSDNPLTGSFIAFELKCCECADWRRFDSPERPCLIIRAIGAIADAVPPATGFAPPREHCMDAKPATSKGEFDRSRSSINKELTCRDYFTRHFLASLDFEQMFEK